MECCCKVQGSDWDSGGSNDLPWPRRYVLSECIIWLYYEIFEHQNLGIDATIIYSSICDLNQDICIGVQICILNKNLISFEHC